jgi:hypothetical protein
MAQLYRREVATAAFHIMPFLKFLRTQAGAGEWPLAVTVDRYLAQR